MAAALIGSCEEAVVFPVFTGADNEVRIGRCVVDVDHLDLIDELVREDGVVGLIEVDDRADARHWWRKRLNPAEDPRRTRAAYQRHGLAVQVALRVKVGDRDGGHDGSPYGELRARCGRAACPPYAASAVPCGALVGAIEVCSLAVRREPRRTRRGGAQRFCPRVVSRLPCGLTVVSPPTLRRFAVRAHPTPHLTRRTF